MISEDDLRELEATLLPALERHHLRLLAHALRTFQSLGEGVWAEGSGCGLPARAQLEAWAAAQPAIADDPGFRDAFVEQLLGAGVQLEEIAAWRRRSGGEGAASPLALQLNDLVAWARQQADARLNLPGQAPGASPPPT